MGRTTPVVTRDYDVMQQDIAGRFALDLPEVRFKCYAVINHEGPVRDLGAAS